MKKITYLLCIFMLSFAVPGCGKNLDNADFIPEFVYDGSGEAPEPEEPGEIVPDKVAVNQLKVISFNVRVGTGDANTKNAWDLRKKAIPAILKKENPTVFGVQEALKMQMDYLKEQLPGYDAVGVGRDDGKEKGEYMSIFYRKDVVTLEKSGTFWLSQTPDKPSKGWEANYYRTATWAIFRVNATGARFFYMNTHLDHQAKLARENSILLICSKLKELNPEGYPAVLTADFNSRTTDAIFNPLKAVMLDARATAPVTDNLGTFNGWGASDSVIDHIFYNGLDVLSYRTIRDVYYGIQYASDHYPIAGLFEFTDID
ncbi:MAG: endonuclease/exonuclease/phosphatase family protein [Clostridium sp.]|nr:endonuclease/exonuclease/phosphatase family protein [Bacteroides sp.]MCM1198907.1 endonuclease/exonuclease/phosphatase family protein [Clostridium sp.]